MFLPMLLSLVVVASEMKDEDGHFGNGLGRLAPKDLALVSGAGQDRSAPESYHEGVVDTAYHKERVQSLCL